ncbi:MAG: adenine phosphoribosyltransferase [Clostridia bacterium]|nr:adenine phosphoribosyltransferase [Clostridia bacterium]MBQ2236572.1 adenine phosphoribosyltransferase [Clostridia bacterium]MEE1185367.1 phosphoribosyltransferase family protein [Acutalibacteraceae bacterium]
MSEYYTMKIAGLERNLEKFPVNDKLDIAAFIIFGDVELTVVGCAELLKKVPDFDVILTPEAKSIPMAYEMARQSGKPYVIARKGMKVYMRNPVEVSVTSITTKNEQKLFLGETEVNKIKGKRVLIIDDVISTGESLAAVRELVKKSGGIEAAACAFLAEGDAAERKDIIFLEKLPLFFK